MSGGVDSSVAALLLKRQGYDVVGVFMKNWTEKVPGLIYCPWEEDQRSARMAAAKIAIPFYTWDFEKDYKQIVFSNFIEGYQKGETPNPDVICNKEIKFGLFLKKARKLGADFIATGHYVRLRRKFPISNFSASTPRQRRGSAVRRAEGGGSAVGGQFPKNYSITQLLNYKLFTAKDSNKDQSYFLWTLKQPQLKYCLFPLGDLTKPEVRKIAQKAGLPNAKRKDSQGLCFVGKVSLKDFLKPYIPQKQGDIVLIGFSAKGGSAFGGDKNRGRHEEIIGKHQGVHLFTLGQRSGIGIGGGKPFFVCAKNKKKNILYACEKRYLSKFFPARVSLKNFSFVNPGEVKFPIRCSARYRYRQPLHKVRIGKDSKGKALVVFAKPAVAITPGQSIVFYQGKQMLGGGIIKQIPRVNSTRGMRGRL